MGGVVRRERIQFLAVSNANAGNSEAASLPNELMSHLMGGGKSVFIYQFLSLAAFVGINELSSGSVFLKPEGEAAFSSHNSVSRTVPSFTLRCWLP